MAHLDRNNLALFLRNPARTQSWRIRHWSEFEFGINGWGPFGSGRIVAPITAPWITASALDYVDAHEEWSVDVWYGGLTKKQIWSGPILETEISVSGGRGTVAIELESFLSNFVRRRLDVTGTKVDTAYNAVADIVIGTALRAAFNDTSAGGIVPSSYPIAGTGARTDFGSWTVTAAALNNGGAGDSAVTIAVNTQDGNTLAGIVNYAAEHGDCCLTISETSAAVFSVGVASPYLVSTYSRIPVTPRGGGMKSIARRFGDAQTVNVAQGKGGGSGSSQSDDWHDDTGSVTRLGIVEGSVTIPGGNTATQVTNIAVKYATMLAGPQDTITLDVRGVDQLALGSEWDQRVALGWLDPDTGASGTATVRGWSLKGNTSRVTTSVKLADVVPGALGEIAKAAPMRGPLGSGNMLRNRDG